MTSPLLVERCEDGILQMTLNRPEVRNAVDEPMATALASALDQLDADERCELES